MKVNVLRMDAVLILALSALIAGPVCAASGPDMAAAPTELRRGMYSTGHLAQLLVAQDARGYLRAAPVAADAPGGRAALQDNPAIEIYRRMQKRRFFNR